MKKYLIYLMMAAAVMAFGACSPEDENEPRKPEIETPETPDDGGEETPDNPDEPQQPGDDPDAPTGNRKILVAYSAGAARRSAWRRRSPARPEPTSSASNP